MRDKMFEQVEKLTEVIETQAEIIESMFELLLQHVQTEDENFCEIAERIEESNELKAEFEQDPLNDDGLPF